MNRPRTYTVVGGYQAQDGRRFVTLRGEPRPVPADEALPEGASVRIVGGKAVRA